MHVFLHRHGLAADRNRLLPRASSVAAGTNLRAVVAVIVIQRQQVAGGNPRMLEQAVPGVALGDAILERQRR